MPACQMGDDAVGQIRDRHGGVQGQVRNCRRITMDGGQERGRVLQLVRVAYGVALRQAIDKLV